ncbi:fumarylacetoacetate hydrolase family protein [Ureibacillus sp. 179-F W5.1 NHS]|uniref:fumarylacetoacetate hydrolase family protein n=1 Tax=unclassified Ureibacillus TaxID=2638520 RepID=UPI00311A0E89
MKLLRFSVEDRVHIGVKQGNRIIDLTAYAKSRNYPFPNTMEQIITSWNKVSVFIESLIPNEIERFRLTEGQLQFLPVVESPEKIICVGVNYQEHADESNLAVLDDPVLFNKFTNSLNAHQNNILMPATSKENDYEGELVVIIGKVARNISKEDALNYVFGYSIANDISSRDWQFRTHQWMLGKAIDGYCPVGPYIVTADEIQDPHHLNIRTYVNGEIRQNANTSQMIFNCADIISYLSAHMTLMPGDVILTGTPEGVILGMDPSKRQYLQAGDIVEIEIEGIGRLKNKFVR